MEATRFDTQPYIDQLKGVANPESAKGTLNFSVHPESKELFCRDSNSKWFHLTDSTWVLHNGLVDSPKLKLICSKTLGPGAPGAPPPADAPARPRSAQCYSRINPAMKALFLLGFGGIVLYNYMRYPAGGRLGGAAGVVIGLVIAPGLLFCTRRSMLGATSDHFASKETRLLSKAAWVTALAFIGYQVRSFDIGKRIFFAAAASTLITEATFRLLISCPCASRQER